nr:hypothetical protein [Escherichia coli]
MPKKHMCRWLLPGLLGLVLCAPVPNTYAAFPNSKRTPNSENVLVVWDDPVVAQKYLNHWTSRWVQGTDWKQTY